MIASVCARVGVCIKRGLLLFLCCSVLVCAKRACLSFPFYIGRARRGPLLPLEPKKQAARAAGRGKGRRQGGGQEGGFEAKTLAHPHKLGHAHGCHTTHTQHIACCWLWWQLTAARTAARREQQRHRRLNAHCAFHNGGRRSCAEVFCVFCVFACLLSFLLLDNALRLRVRTHNPTTKTTAGRPRAPK